jgi:hypothetical protein
MFHCTIQVWGGLELDPQASDLVLGVFGKLLTRRGAWAFGSMTFGLAMQKLLNIGMISSPKIKSNSA